MNQSRGRDGVYWRTVMNGSPITWIREAQAAMSLELADIEEIMSILTMSVKRRTVLLTNA